MTEARGDDPLADGLSQLVDEFGLWEVHQALAALWLDAGMVLEPPYKPRVGSSVPAEIAKEYTPGTPLAPTMYLPLGTSNIAAGSAVMPSTSFSLTFPAYDYQAPVVPPQWLPDVLGQALADEDDEE